MSLCDAVWAGDLTEVCRLLSLGNPKDVNTPNSRGQSPLYCACRQGFVDIAVTLLNAPEIQIDYQVPEHGGTALHAAGHQNRAPIVALLLAKGADSQLQNKTGMSARQEARGAIMDLYTLYEQEKLEGLLKAFPIVSQLNFPKEKERKSQSKKSRTTLVQSGGDKERKSDKEKKAQRGSKLLGTGQDRSKRRSLQTTGRKDSALNLTPLKIFGEVSTELATMEQLLEYDRRKLKLNFLDVPIIIKSCIDFLMLKGLNSEGLFRVPGRLNKLSFWENEYNGGRGFLIDFLKSEEEPEDVASLLKKYLRDMPDKPLFTDQYQKSFSEIYDLESENERVAAYQSLVTKLPSLNQIVIQKLLRFLMQVAENSSVNRMNPSALAIVFGSMAGVFATEAGDMVQWVIQAYPKLYEEAEIESARDLLLLRKFVTNQAPLIGFLQYQDFILSFDTSGCICIRNRENYTFVKTVDLNLSLTAKPIIDNEFLYVVGGKIVQPMGFELISANVRQIYKMSEILDLENTAPRATSQPLLFNVTTMHCVSNDEVWVAGEEIAVGNDRAFMPIGETGDYKSLTSGPDAAWAIRNNDLELWHKTDLTLQSTFTGSAIFGENYSFHSILSFISPNVWISGKLGSSAVVWVFNTETGQAEKLLKKSKDVFNEGFFFDDFLWTVCADSRITAWETKTMRSFELGHLHSSAPLSCIHVEKRHNGYIMWTGSEDKSINVQFVPLEYLKGQTLTKSAKTKAPKPSKQAPIDLWANVNWVEATYTLLLALAKRDARAALELAPEPLKKALQLPRPKIQHDDNQHNCSICSEVLFSAVSVGCPNKHPACFKCLFHRKDDTCPTCQSPYSQISIDATLQETLNAFMSSCPVCPWTGSAKLYCSHPCEQPITEEIQSTTETQLQPSAEPKENNISEEPITTPHGAEPVTFAVEGED